MAEPREPIVPDPARTSATPTETLVSPPPRYDGESRRIVETRGETEPTTQLLKEVMNEAGKLVRSEADLMRMELRESARNITRDIIKAALFSGVAVAGLLSLLAFAIIGLGDLIAGDTEQVSGYWISALVIGVLFTAIGAGMAYKYSKSISQDGQLPRTQNELEKNRAFLQATSHDLREAVRP